MGVLSDEDDEPRNGGGAAMELKDRSILANSASTGSFKMVAEGAWAPDAKYIVGW